jgi:hypothetical protein
LRSQGDLHLQRLDITDNINFIDASLPGENRSSQIQVNTAVGLKGITIL